MCFYCWSCFGYWLDEKRRGKGNRSNGEACSSYICWPCAQTIQTNIIWNIYGFLFVVDVDWIDLSYAYRIQSTIEIFTFEVDWELFDVGFNVVFVFVFFLLFFFLRTISVCGKYMNAIQCVWMWDVRKFYGFVAGSIPFRWAHQFVWTQTMFGMVAGGRWHKIHMNKLQSHDDDILPNIYLCWICSCLFVYVTPPIS